MKMTKGTRYYAKYYESDAKVENGSPLYLIVHSSVFHETRGYWMAYKYSYTPDWVNGFRDLLGGYNRLWTGFETLKDAKEYCIEYEAESY